MFAIRLVLNAGGVRYYSSKRNFITSEIAEQSVIFASKSSAERCVKKLRKNGHEKDGVFDVVEFGYHINNIIEVPRPVQKCGFVIKLSNDRHFAGYMKPYDGRISVNILYEWKPDITLAKVFRTEKIAHARIAGILDNLKDFISQQHKLAADTATKTYWSIRDRERDKKMYLSNVDKAEALYQLVENATLIRVG